MVSEQSPLKLHYITVPQFSPNLRYFSAGFRRFQSWNRFHSYGARWHLYKFQLDLDSITRGFLGQEPITRSLQLFHIPVTAFSQNDLFLVWIYLEFTEIPTRTSVTIYNHKHGLMLTISCRHDVHMFTWGRIVLSLPKRAHEDWNWPISREKYLKID